MTYIIIHLDFPLASTSWFNLSLYKRLYEDNFYGFESFSTVKITWNFVLLFMYLFLLAPSMEHILAVANEEGFVRLYNTESQTSKKKCFKGKYNFYF
jgi:hypothetical protein